VRNEKVFQRVMDDRNILQTVKRKKGNWIGRILCRNCLLKHVTEGKVEGKKKVTGRRGKRCKQLLEELKEKRKYCKPKQEAIDRSLWRTRFRTGSEPVARQTKECMNTRNLLLFMV